MARIVAQRFRNTPDVGSCNLDRVAWFLPDGIRASTVQQVGPVSRWMKFRVIFLYFGEGQAERNLKMNEAACRVLRDTGWNVAMYYQTD